ncbi:MAG TPA: hypothetical protein VIT88_02710 [Pyrinomonadaceae bacterium]
MVCESDNSTQSETYSIAIVQLSSIDRFSVDERRLLRTKIDQRDSLLIIYFECGVNFRYDALGNDNLALRGIAPYYGTNTFDEELASRKLSDEPL